MSDRQPRPAAAAAAAAASEVTSDIGVDDEFHGGGIELVGACDMVDTDRTTEADTEPGMDDLKNDARTDSVAPVSGARIEANNAANSEAVPPAPATPPPPTTPAASVAEVDRPVPATPPPPTTPAASVAEVDRPVPATSPPPTTPAASVAEADRPVPATPPPPTTPANSAVSTDPRTVADDTPAAAPAYATAPAVAAAESSNESGAQHAACDTMPPAIAAAAASATAISSRAIDEPSDVLSSRTIGAVATGASTDSKTNLAGAETGSSAVIASGTRAKQRPPAAAAAAAASEPSESVQIDTCTHVGAMNSLGSNAEDSHAADAAGFLPLLDLSAVELRHGVDMNGITNPDEQRPAPSHHELFLSYGADVEQAKRAVEAAAFAAKSRRATEQANAGYVAVNTNLPSQYPGYFLQSSVNGPSAAVEKDITAAAASMATTAEVVTAVPRTNGLHPEAAVSKASDAVRKVANGDAPNQPRPQASGGIVAVAAKAGKRKRNDNIPITIKPNAATVSPVERKEPSAAPAVTTVAGPRNKVPAAAAAAAAAGTTRSHTETSGPNEKSNGTTHVSSQPLPHPASSSSAAASAITSALATAVAVVPASAAASAAAVAVVPASAAASATAVAVVPASAAAVAVVPASAAAVAVVPASAAAVAPVPASAAASAAAFPVAAPAAASSSSKGPSGGGASRVLRTMATDAPFKTDGKWHEAKLPLMFGSTSLPERFQKHGLALASDSYLARIYDGTAIHYSEVREDSSYSCATAIESDQGAPVLDALHGEVAYLATRNGMFVPMVSLVCDSSEHAKVPAETKTKSKDDTLCVVEEALSKLYTPAKDSYSVNEKTHHDRVWFLIAGSALSETLDPGSDEVINTTFSATMCDTPKQVRTIVKGARFPWTMNGAIQFSEMSGLWVDTIPVDSPVLHLVRGNRPMNEELLRSLRGAFSTSIVAFVAQIIIMENTCALPSHHQNQERLRAATLIRKGLVTEKNCKQFVLSGKGIEHKNVAPFMRVFDAVPIEVLAVARTNTTNPSSVVLANRSGIRVHVYGIPPPCTEFLDFFQTSLNEASCARGLMTLHIPCTDQYGDLRLDIGRSVFFTPSHELQWLCDEAIQSSLEMGFKIGAVHLHHMTQQKSDSLSEYLKTRETDKVDTTELHLTSVDRHKLLTTGNITLTFRSENSSSARGRNHAEGEIHPLFGPLKSLTEKTELVDRDQRKAAGLTQLDVRCITLVKKSAAEYDPLSAAKFSDRMRRGPFMDGAKWVSYFCPFKGPDAGHATGFPDSKSDIEPIHEMLLKCAIKASGGSDEVFSRLCNSIEQDSQPAAKRRKTRSNLPEVITIDSDRDSTESDEDEDEDDDRDDEDHVETAEQKKKETGTPKKATAKKTATAKAAATKKTRKSKSATPKTKARTTRARTPSDPSADVAVAAGAAAAAASDATSGTEMICFLARLSGEITAAAARDDFHGLSAHATSVYQRLRLLLHGTPESAPL